MYQAIGLHTEKIYATGSKEYCFRKLGNDFPSVNDMSRSRMLPEPMQVIKGDLHVGQAAKNT